MSLRIAIALLLVCLAYALTACGGGEEPFEPDQQRTNQPVPCDVKPELCA